MRLSGFINVEIAGSGGFSASVVARQFACCMLVRRSVVVAADQGHGLTPQISTVGRILRDMGGAPLSVQNLAFNTCWRVGMCAFEDAQQELVHLQEQDCRMTSDLPALYR